MTDFAARLRASGMSAREALAKARLFERAAEALAALAPQTAHTEPLAFFVPGRIEVLGKHTDYAGGRSLLCAMERGFTVLAVPRDDARVRVVDAQGGQTRELAPDTELDVSPGDWSAYVRTVARRVARDFPEARRGVDLAFASDLPAASGMSSSSALVVAIFLALHAANDLEHDVTYRRIIPSPEVLGGYLGAVENGRIFAGFAGDHGVGTLGGSQDQTAILCCRAGMLSRYSFCPVRAEGEIFFPPDRAFVVAFSGIAAAKTSNARLQYNEASLAVSRILAIWNDVASRNDGCLADAVTSDPSAGDEIRALLRRATSSDFTSRRLLDRFEQFMAESFDIIPHAADAFARCDLLAIGELVGRSQHGVESLLGNQVPQTIALVRLAHREGADAASAFGAGFGGSVWALVAAERAEQFASKWRNAYRGEFPGAARKAEFFVTRPGPGAMRL